MQTGAKVLQQWFLSWLIWKKVLWLTAVMELERLIHSFRLYHLHRWNRELCPWLDGGDGQSVKALLFFQIWRSEGCPEPRGPREKVLKLSPNFAGGQWSWAETSGSMCLYAAWKWHLLLAADAHLEHIRTRWHKNK